MGEFLSKKRTVSGVFSVIDDERRNYINRDHYVNLFYEWK